MNRTFRHLIRAGIGFSLYVVVGALLHWVVFPEDEIPTELHPQVGDAFQNILAGEHVRFLETGERSVIEVTLSPGGAIPVAHAHGHTKEVFTIKQGQVQGIIGGETLRL